MVRRKPRVLGVKWKMRSRRWGCGKIVLIGFVTMSILLLSSL